MKTICIFLAEGFEEMEAMFPLDVMRRGGLNVKTVSEVRPEEQPFPQDCFHSM